MAAAGAGSSVQVAVRARPLSDREQDLASEIVLSMRGNEVTVRVPYTSGAFSHRFSYDHAFWSPGLPDMPDKQFAGQSTVFGAIGLPVVDHCFEGFNVCVFAYGQTGSGKSFTMFGNPHLEEEVGLIPRLTHRIFSEVEQRKSRLVRFTVNCSYLEIYNEKVKCLLNPALHNLKVREHPESGPYVEALTKAKVANHQEVFRLMHEGNRLRTTASTSMNAHSSRSHAVFQLQVCQEIMMEDGENVMSSKTARLNLVDLAGSERVSKSHASGVRLQEGANINKSLVCLGKVIAALADASGAKPGPKSKAHHIPFRDSALTWVLKENLGGNSKTIMLAALSPHSGNYEESLSTLRYADRAKRIKTHAVKNEDPTTKKIRELQEEVERLKQLLEGREGAASPSPPPGDTGAYEELSTRERLAMTAQALQEATMTWGEKEARDELVKQERSKALQELGITVEMDKSRPSLINLNEDPFMEGCLVYYLNATGVTRVGSGEGLERKPDILLIGDDILPEHCTIDCGDGAGDALPVLRVEGEARVMVNGAIVTEAAELAPRARLIIGLRHFFRFSHPRLDKAGGDPQEAGAAPVDFAMALREVEEKARAEAEAEKEAFRQAILEEVVRDDAERDERMAEMERARLAAEERLAQVERDLKAEREAKQAAERKAAEQQEQAEREREREREREQERTQKADAAQAERVKKEAMEKKRADAEAAAAPVEEPQELGIRRRSLGPPGKAKHVDVSLFNQTRREVKRLPPQLIRRYKVILVGHEEVGKTSLRKCWQGDPMLFFSKRLPEVQCTTGIEIQNHTLKMADEELELSVCDFAGQEVYHSHSLFLTPRTVFVLVWKMSAPGADGGMSDYEDERITGWVDEVYAKAPGSAVFIVGTHQDELSDRRLPNLNRICQRVKRRFEEYVEQIRVASDSGHTLRVLGSYAVSCKTRQCWGEGFQQEKGAKMSELLKVIGQCAMQDCCADEHFPNGAIPGREVQFMRELERIKRDRKKLLVPVSEYQQMAAEFGIEEAKELYACTNLFHCWNVVYVFSQSQRIEDNPFIFLYPVWLSHMVSAVFSFAHVLYTPPEMRRFIGGLDYDIETVLRADRGAMRQGELSMAAAKVILSRSVRIVRGEKEKDRAPIDPADLEMCLQLLCSLDLVYRDEATDRDRRRSPQVPYRYYIPSLFPSSCPLLLKDAAPYLFQKGLTRMYQFNLFPRELFFRVVCRLHDLQVPVEATLQQRPDLGADEQYLPPDWTQELRSHWRDGLWIGHGPDTRALIYQEDTLIYVYVTVPRDHEPGPAAVPRGGPRTPEQFAQLVDDVVRGVTDEYAGLSVTCCLPSPGAPGENWFDLEMLRDVERQQGPEGAVACQRSERNFPVSELLSDGTPLPSKADVDAGELWEELYPNLTTALGADGACALLGGLGCFVADEDLRLRAAEGAAAEGAVPTGEGLDRLVKVIMFLDAASSEGGRAAQPAGRRGV
eukprot:TRINITY_DN399_c0_g2_i1.p1 TRINITY_DN399_c0_g2~~TRINITY_DN399_c0_g2_i1.p1  ORF type:complete len:1497 (+),score=628.13 TRINITY_DN399_c0_g2_i1:79-4491(+)